MITGTYTYNDLKQELKPTNQHSPIHSLRVGRVTPSVFVNYVGKCEATTARPAKTLSTDDGTVYVFRVESDRYYFEVPDSPTKKTLIKVYKLTPRVH